MKTITCAIIGLFEAKGYSLYGGEPVTQLQHALQCAQLALKEGATEELITAALLHDIGHLLHDLPDDAPDNGIDDVHENVGGHFLSKHFPTSVTEPISLHVAAKRYLCATEPAYLQLLSPTSITSLQLQGGPMSPDEQAAFEQAPYHRDAVRLRRWDDEAKDPEMTTADLAFFAKIADRCALA